LPVARRLAITFWWYAIAVSLIGFGFAEFSLLAYHFDRAQSVAPTWISAFDALAMGAGGLASLRLGKLVDRIGLIALVPITIVAVAYAPLCFFGGVGAALLGSVLWGAGLGAHASVMPAAVANMIPQRRLGAAYGLFLAVFLVSPGLPAAPPWGACMIFRFRPPCGWRSWHSCGRWVRS
jgi:MFS family permease